MIVIKMDKIEQIIAEKFQETGIQYTIKRTQCSRLDDTVFDSMHIDFIKGDLSVPGYYTAPDESTPCKMEIADVKSRLTGNYQNISGDETVQETILISGLFALLCRDLSDTLKTSLDDMCLALTGYTYGSNEINNIRLWMWYNACIKQSNDLVRMIKRDKVEEFAALHKQCTNLYAPPLRKSVMIEEWRRLIPNLILATQPNASPM